MSLMRNAALGKLTVEHTVTALLFVGVAALACLSPVHNDTWWHLRNGQEMSASGGFAQIDRFSFTAFGQPFPNHEWLGERFLYACFALGGLPGLTAACALMVVSGWWISWRMMRGALSDRLVIFVAALMASTTIWSLRPQVFTILFLPLTATLLSAEMFWPLPLLTLVWANVHGGVLLGLIAISAATVARATMLGGQVPARHVVALAASIGATCVTPLGLRYWPEILASLGRSRENGIIEWRAPSFSSEHLIFWVGAAFFLALALSRWRQLGGAGDHELVAAAGALLPPATQAIRSIPTFAILAAPAVSRLVTPNSVPSRRFDGRPDSRRHIFTRLAAVALAAAIAAVGVAHMWSQPWSRLGWTPMSADAARAVNICHGPVYNRYGDGGVLIWFARDNKVFLDSRQDPFPVSLVKAASEVERTGDYADLFAKWHINCAALPPTSPTVARLSADGWKTTFRDSRWVVLDRSSPVSTAPTPSPAP
jgi:hypothetical protein